MSVLDRLYNDEGQRIATSAMFDGLRDGPKPVELGGCANYLLWSIGKRFVTNSDTDGLLVVGDDGSHVVASQEDEALLTDALDLLALAGEPVPSQGPFNGLLAAEIMRALKRLADKYLDKFLNE